MQRISLPREWTVTATGGDDIPDDITGRAVAATVPGCVHTDLLAAGLIPDPYLDRNERLVQWIGRTDWQYRTSFSLTHDMLDHGRVELVCEGLDTIATIELNGRAVGTAANMHHPHTFDVKPALVEGENELTVTFSAPVTYVHAVRQSDPAFQLPHVNHHPYNVIRKMACNFGWDWGPDLATCGIWRPIYLAAWDGARLNGVRPVVASADSSAAVVEVHVDLAVEDGGDLSGWKVSAALSDPDNEKVAATVAAVQDTGPIVLRLHVAQPRLWWPRGYGDQPLYALNVTLSGDNEKITGSWTQDIGLRSVRLNTDEDKIGEAMTLEINGQPVFCKGANWIPDDCFPHRVDEDRYRRRLTQACQAGMNMVRVWGGGLYETDTFYDLCDQLGLMVWQDFLFACAAYPETDEMMDRVEAEARYNVARLAGRASLVLWNGCNENLWGYEDWGWKSPIGDKPWGPGYYLELLPSVVAELDPTRPYIPGSPWSGSPDRHPQLDTHGCMHMWDVWNDVDYGAYRKHRPRFASEFGFQGTPTWATFDRAIPTDQRQPESDAILLHQKAEEGPQKLRQRLAEHFPPTDDYDDWLYLTQVNQARAVAAGVTWLRSLRPRCMGTLYWQLNDCWPVTSWSAIDGDGRPKPLWYATRRFYAPRLLTIQPTADGLAVFGDNDTDEPWQETIHLQRIGFDGTVRAEGATVLSAAPRSCVRLEMPRPELASPDDPTGELLVARGATVRDVWFFDVDRNLRYPQADVTAELSDDGAELTLTAGTLVRDLAVFADRLDPSATVSDQLITLLPGDSAVLTIAADSPLSLEQLTRPPVMRCVNPFGARGR
jgi:beta-mannosidase